MNFTREPIIETIITPKEGYKLIIRNSKGGSLEEYSIDAVEVVSFGRSFFYRSLERPRSFLLPVSDYEVIETKETRVVLKNVPLERSIKIGGGKSKGNSDEVSEEGRQDEKPKRRKTLKRRKGFEERPDLKNEDQSKESKLIQVSSTETKKEDISLVSNEENSVKEVEKKTQDQHVSSSMFRSLFPPPPSLIKKEHLVIPESKNEKKHFLEEDNMEKPSLEDESKKEMPKEEEDDNNLPKSGPEVEGESRNSFYHQAPSENETQDNKDDQKTQDVEKTSLPFTAENNFAY